jgi:AcrR family transcriptional regulator
VGDRGLKGDQMKRKLKRAEKADANRKVLLTAAADVVGTLGYADASIARIAERAGLAQGTFYLYFESRQDLFDQLLPRIGEMMLDHVRESIKGAREFFEIEERGLTAFFNFLVENPEFFRILYETDAVSPSAGERHINLLVQKYTRVVERAVKERQIKCLSTIERDVLIYLMMGARDYLSKYIRRSKSNCEVKIKRIVDAYMSILRNGVRDESTAQIKEVPSAAREGQSAPTAC